MTDQIYYKVQYPLKKALNIFKNIESENQIFQDFSDEDEKKLNNFLQFWENEGREELERFIDELKNINKKRV
ncbi:MAG: hypothetical protein ACOC4G_04980 [Bacillota bacterium]